MGYCVGVFNWAETCDFFLTILVQFKQCGKGSFSLKLNNSKWRRNVNKSKEEYKGFLKIVQQISVSINRWKAINSLASDLKEVPVFKIKEPRTAFISPRSWPWKEGPSLTVLFLMRQIWGKIRTETFNPSLSGWLMFMRPRSASNGFFPI